MHNHTKHLSGNGYDTRVEENTSNFNTCTQKPLLTWEDNKKGGLGW